MLDFNCEGIEKDNYCLTIKMFGSTNLHPTTKYHQDFDILNAGKKYKSALNQVFESQNRANFYRSDLTTEYLDRRRAE